MILDILEEHIEEADFLFSQRQLAFKMLDLNGEDLVEMDERLRAHLNGLLLGGDTAWEFVKGFLVEGSVGEAFVASIVAMEGDQPDHLDELEEALPTAPPQVFEGVRGACCLTVWPGINACLKRLLDHDAPIAKAVAIEAMSYRKIDPGNDVLVKALDSPSEALVLAGLQAVGRLRLRRHQRAVQDYAAMGESALQAAALESLAMLDPQAAHAQCLAVLKEGGPYAATAASLLGVFAKKQDLNVLVRAAGSQDNKPQARAAILALGAMGDTDAVPFLIELLGNDNLARVAGAALGQIFGDQLPDDEAPPEASQEAKSDPKKQANDQIDDEDEKDWEPDDDLPRLSAEAIQAWWSKNRYSFPAGTRYRHGQPYEPGILPSSATPLGLVKLVELERVIVAPATQAVSC